MLSPTNTTIVPPRGWSVDLGLGPIIKSDNYPDFLRQIYQRLHANHADRHGWKEWALSLMCEQRPDIPCLDSGAPPSRAVTSDDIRRFVFTMLEAKREGAVAVSPGEQDRRAAICLSCPNRGNVSCFGGCGALAEALSELVVSAKGAAHPELHKEACLSCGCELSSLILYPLDVLHKVDEKIDFLATPYSPQCWKRPENQPVP